MKNILLIDANAPWVRSLFSAMKDQALVHALNVQNLFTGHTPQIGRLVKWGYQADGLWSKPVLIPGWTRFPKISNYILRRSIRKAQRKIGKFDAVVYTLPFYADVAVHMRGQLPQIYDAHDPFRFYDNWNPARTGELERKMLEVCDRAFAISQLLAEDLRRESGREIIYSPNAVSSDFVRKLQSDGPLPAALQSLPRPIVGCVGQINHSYDWKMIDAIAQALPDVTFAFVGPMIEPSPLRRTEIERILRRRNIRWLGPRPHAELPGYLRGFDVCFNPLAINEHNDRRSPLRLYDYLATDKPILSTAIAEAKAQGAMIETFAEPHRGIELLKKMLEGGYAVDLPARRSYIQQNTWEARARQFLSCL